MYCQYNSHGLAMILVRLREAMDAYRQKTGDRMTHEKLAERTGLSRATLDSIASRTGYNASLSTIDRICSALGCTLAQLLEHIPDGAAEEARKCHSRRGARQDATD